MPEVLPIFWQFVLPCKQSHLPRSRSVAADITGGNCCRYLTHSAIGNEAGLPSDLPASPNGHAGLRDEIGGSR
jgi:hypothetical protein